MGPTEPRVTIEDVAARAGVSATAVSFVLNERSGVGTVARSRIRKAMAELKWSPSARARALASRKAFAIGLVLSRPAILLSSDLFFARFIAGVESVLSQRGYSLMLRVVGEDAQAEVEGYQWLAAQGRVDGFLLLDLRVEDPRFALLERLAVPALAVGLPAGRCPYPWLAIDDRPPMRRLVEHLVGLGHRHIAHVTGRAGFVHTASRRAAWRAVLEEAGLPPGPEQTGDFTAYGGAAATKRLLQSDALAHAIVYANDAMALGGMQTLREAGLRVPDDVSVTGFDDVPLGAYAQPPLTTVTQDVEAWGHAAATGLLAALGGASIESGRVGQADLLLRGSTSAPPADGTRSHPIPATRPGTGPATRGER